MERVNKIDKLCQILFENYGWNVAAAFKRDVEEYAEKQYKELIKTMHEEEE